MKTRVFLLLALLAVVRVEFLPASSQKGAPPPPQAPSTPAAPTLTGRVLSAETGKPLPAARVDVFPYLDPAAARERRASGDPSGEPIASGACDATGRFQIEVPAQARLMVVAAAPGHARCRLRRTVFTRDDAGRLDLGRLELEEGRRLAGRVLDASGKPMIGAKVVAIPSGSARRRGGPGPRLGLARSADGDLSSFPAIGRTDAAGTFQLDSVARVPVDLRVYAEKMAPALLQAVRSSSGVTIRMAPGEALAGKVVAPDGKTPVGGAWVVAGEEGWDGVTRSKSDGSFRLEMLRRGPVSLHATTSDASVTPTTAGPQRDTTASTASFAPSAPLDVNLPPAAGGGPTLKMLPGGSLRARAIDAESRAPIGGAVLSLSAPGESEPRLGLTGAAGEIVFTGVPAGRITLGAEAERYLAQTLDPIPLAAGQTRETSAALRAAAALEGTVRDTTGRVVAGASVSVAGHPDIVMPIRMPIFLPMGVEPVVTDEQGRFALEELPPKEELKISVSAADFVPWDLTGITLRPGERRKDLEVLLDAGSTITGRLVASDGTPVAGASVTASRRREGGGGIIMIQSGGPGRGGGRGRGGPMSDDLQPVLSTVDGDFTVRGARPGVWSLAIESPGFAPHSVAGLKLENSGNLDAGEIVLAPGAVLKGRVVSTTGEPIPLANGVVRRDFLTLSEFTTTSDGTFVTSDLLPGEPVTLRIDTESHAAYEKGGLIPPMEDLVVTLAAASRVGGKVVTGAARRPVQDFSIAISRTRSAGGGGGMMMNMRMGGEEVAVHAEDGAFTIDDVDPGKVTITARAPGYKESTLRELEIPEGGALEGLEFVVDKAGTVAGTVMDDRGRPLPGVKVQQKEASGGFGMMIRSGEDGGTTTDGDGRFLVAGLDRGPATLTFTHRDFEPAEREVDTTSDVEGLRVTLSRGATLTGTVLREEDGSPVSGASVTATAAGADRFSGASTVTTGLDGSFTFDAVAAGRYAVRAEAPGLSSGVVDGVIVAAGIAPPPVELRLGGGVSLTGTLTGVKEADLPKFTVRAVTQGVGGFGATAAVDAAGRFEFKGMAAGPVTLIAGSGFLGGRSATRTVEIPQGVATFETTIAFPRGRTVAGVVTRGGQPVDGASVMFANTANRSRASATADVAGHYVVEDLDDGDYDVSVMQFSLGISHTTKTTVRADDEFDIALPVSRIQGYVVDAATRRPIDGASISYQRSGDASPTAGSGVFLQRGSGTDASGYFAIEGLADGTYTLTVRRDGYGFASRSVLVSSTIPTDELSIELSRVDSISFKAIDAGSGMQLHSLSVLVLAGGGDPLSATGSGATVAFQGVLTADESGVFHLEALPPGSYCVVLGGSGLATETLYDIKAPASEWSVSLVPAGILDVRASQLRPGQTARGVLIDATGRPAHTSTFFAEPTFIIRPDAPAIVADVKPGSYRLRVAMPDGGIQDKPVAVAPGATTQVAIP
ncbi:MAG TPA: carboxypeptidase regulatory-like domain-containing protein [Candidatus Polarisedimenticolia bacterium]|nr:carboxypeptidase regulatory-like domain-containing protein [Candidatus Polarisedimenticolia bacterium]